MKKLLVLVAFLACAPLARAQENGHYETRIVTETTPGHYEVKTEQVWQEPWTETRTRKLDDGTVETTRIEHPGSWQTVTERVWIPGETRKVARRVWVADDYVNPWEDAPKAKSTGRTEEPTAPVPPTGRSEEPTAPRQRLVLPPSTEKVEKDPFAVEEHHTVVPAPADEKRKEEIDPLIAPSQGYVVPAPAPVEQRVVVVREPETRVVYVRDPEPVVRRVVYVNDCPSYCWPRRCWRDECPVVVREPCVPRVAVGVGVRVTRHVGVGVRVGF